MIDSFAIILTHGLLLLTAWRLVSRADLDSDAPEDQRGWLSRNGSEGAPDA